MATLASCEPCYSLYRRRFEIGYGLTARSRRSPLSSTTFVGKSGYSIKLRCQASADDVSFSSLQEGSRKDSDDARTTARKTRRRRSYLPPKWEELATPLPESPNYLLIAAGVSLLYFTRRAIFHELVNWLAVATVLGEQTLDFAVWLLRVVLHYFFKVVRTPLTVACYVVVWAGTFIRDLYSFIATTTSLWPTLRSLLLVTMVLSMGETVRTSAVSSQPRALFVVSLFAVAAVFGIIHPLVFAILLVVSVMFAIVVQKKDAVTAFLPATAMLVGVAEPPMIVVTMLFYLGLVLYTHWKQCNDSHPEYLRRTDIAQPMVMIVTALFLGLAAAATHFIAWRTLLLAKLQQ